ncbi:MAG: tetratricopeptide repeat protein [Ignavibacteriales bacterium]|nr:tetratricopeptide repeat protein [Ignavibacteriales bacterium]
MAGSFFKFSLILSCLLAILYIVGTFFPNGFVWGFNTLSLLPNSYTIGYIILSIGLISLLIKKPPTKLIEQFGLQMESKPYHFLVTSIIVYLFFAWLFRVATPLFGDGIYIVKNFSETLNGGATLDLRNEPLSTAYFFGIVKLLKVTTYEQLLNAFLVASMILGIGFITAVFFIVRNLFDQPVQKFLSFMFMLSFPYMLLFFGYVETYGIAILAATLYLLSIILYIRGKLSLTGVVILFFVMALSHYLSLLFLPTLIFIGFLEYKNNGLKSALKGTAVLVSLILLLLLMINFDLQNFYAWTPHSHFLPFVAGEDELSLYTEPYTLFDAVHGSELLNYFLLLGGTSIAIIIFIFLTNRQLLWHSYFGKFFLIAALPLFVLTIILKFDLGLAKDWDVMAPYFPVVALWAAWLIAELKPVRLTASFGTITIITLLSTVSFIAVHARTDSNLRRYQTLFEPKTVSNYGYYSSTLSLVLYYHQIKNTQGPIDAWNRYTELYPFDPQGHQNLITNLKSLGPPGIPYNLNAYERWLGAIPTDTAAYIEYVTYCIDAGNYLFEKGELKGAEAIYRRTITLAPTYERAYNNLGSVLAQNKQSDSALVYFQKAIDLTPSYSDPYYNIGSIEEDRGNKRKAKEYFQKAASLNNKSAIEKIKKLK